jgi:hypothetical protein
MCWKSAGTHLIASHLYIPSRHICTPSCRKRGIWNFVSTRLCMRYQIAAYGLRMHVVYASTSIWGDRKRAIKVVSSYNKALFPLLKCPQQVIMGKFKSSEMIPKIRNLFSSSIKIQEQIQSNFPLMGRVVLFSVDLLFRCFMWTIMCWNTLISLSKTRWKREVCEKFSFSILCSWSKNVWCVQKTCSQSFKLLWHFSESYDVKWCFFHSL